MRTGLESLLSMGAVPGMILSCFGSTRRRRGRQFVVGALAAFLAPALAAADTIDTTGHSMPTPRSRTSSVWTGNGLIVLGGMYGGALDEIVQYSSQIEEFTVLPARLPTPRYGMSTVWDGKHVYAFGGYDGTYLKDILRFDPLSNVVSVMTARLPQGSYYSSAVWDGRYAYVFGGYTSDGGYFGEGTFSRDVLRYDPQTDRLDTISGQLPQGIYGAAAVWDGESAYIFGGVTNGPHGQFLRTDDIVRFSPAAGIASPVTTPLPTPLYGASAVWDGTKTLIFGGENGSPLNTIYSFTPMTGNVSTAPFQLPTPRYDTSAAWNGTRALVVGGMSRWSAYIDGLVEFEPQAGLSQSPSLLPTPRAEIATAWGGDAAYVFGGYDGNGSLDEILRFDPEALTFRLAARLPTPRWGAVAAYDGRNIYVFGGFEPCGQNWQCLAEGILRYDPVGNSVSMTSAKLANVEGAVWGGSQFYLLSGEKFFRYDPGIDTVTSTSARVPYDLSLTSVNGNGSSIYIMGGNNGTGSSKNIYRYTPANDRVELVQVLPGIRQASASYSDGQSIYLFGGFNSVTGGVLSDIVRYSMATNRVEVIDIQLPSARSNFGAVWNGKKGFLFGGYLRWGITAQVIRYIEELGSPRDLQATPYLSADYARGLWQVTVSWQEPLTLGPRPITGYRIYRRAGSGQEILVGTVGRATFSYNHAHADPLTTYCYRVTAITETTTGPSSTTDCAGGLGVEPSVGPREESHSGHLSLGPETFDPVAPTLGLW